MTTRDQLIEAMVLDTYNRFRERRKMPKVDHIGANNTPELNIIRGDVASSFCAIEALGSVVVPKDDIVTIEKAAKAIYTQRNGHGGTPWHNINSQHREPYRKDARAVLAVLEDGKI